MQGPSPTKTVDASASSSSSFTPQSEDEFEIRTVRGASQRKFQRLSSEEVEREFERLSPEEVAKLTPEERCEYQRQADFLHDLFELQEEEDASGEAALRARFDNDNRASKRRRVSTPNGEDDVSEIAEQLKKPPRRRTRAPPLRKRQTNRNAPPRKKQTNNSAPSRKKQTNRSAPPRKKQTNNSAPPRKKQTNNSAPPRKKQTKKRAMRDMRRSCAQLWPPVKICQIIRS